MPCPKNESPERAAIVEKIRDLTKEFWAEFSQRLKPNPVIIERLVSDALFVNTDMILDPI